MSQPSRFLCFSKLCEKVMAQIQRVCDAPLVARLKGMAFRGPDYQPKPFDPVLAMAWLRKAAPREQPRGVSCVPRTTPASLFECDLFARLSEWNALAKPAAATLRKWGAYHAEARGERVAEIVLAR